MTNNLETTILLDPQTSEKDLIHSISSQLNEVFDSFSSVWVPMVQLEIYDNLRPELNDNNAPDLTILQPINLNWILIHDPQESTDPLEEYWYHTITVRPNNNAIQIIYLMNDILSFSEAMRHFTIHFIQKWNPQQNNLLFGIRVKWIEQITLATKWLGKVPVLKERIYTFRQDWSIE